MTTTGKWVDLDDAPTLEPEWFDGADVKVAGEVVSAGDRPKRVGRPPAGGEAKIQQSLRLPPSVIEAFKATGPGWHGRMEAVLRSAVEGATRPSGGELAARHIVSEAGGVDGFVAEVARGDQEQAQRAEWLVQGGLEQVEHEMGARVVSRDADIELDRDVMERFRATGPGWQARVNDALRRAAQ